VKVHQCLHGYLDGHRKLASSVELNRRAEHALLSLSDMSGRAMSEGFEEYITGYPVPESDYFAVARTWYASEMPRPGCVWTHTLLVKREKLFELETLSVFEGMFNRPRVGEYAAYGESLLLDVSSNTTVRVEPNEETRRALILALFGSPSASVLVPLDRPTSGDGLVEFMWTHTSPSLRQFLTFCTGSIASRELGGVAFDLQGIPLRNVRSIQRECRNAVLLPELLEEPTPKWLEPALGQLDDRHEAPFVLATSVARIGARRSMQVLLQKSHLWGDGDLPTEPEQLLKDLILEFPRGEQAKDLKEILLTDTKTTPRERREAMLLAICRMNRSEAFTDSVLDVSGRVTSLFQDQPERTVSLIGRIYDGWHGELAERAIHSLLALVPPADIVTLLAEKRELLLPAVEATPSVGLDGNLWRRIIPSTQHELFGMLCQKYSSDEYENLVTTLAAEGINAPAEAAFSTRGEETARALAHWLESENRVLGREWRMGLVGNISGALAPFVQSGTPNPQLAEIIAAAMDPTESWARHVDLSIWLANARASQGMSHTIRRPIAAFSFVLALHSTGPQAVELLSETFPVVHQALAENALPHRYWNFLDQALPKLSFFRNWDRCARVRLGTVGFLRRENFSVDDFSSSITDSRLKAALGADS